MANPIDSLRDRWEQMPPRERRLVTILVTTIVVGVAFYVALGIRDGLVALEDKNQQKREALRALALYRTGAATTQSVVQIPAEAEKLDRYIDGIIQKIGIESPRYPQPKDTKKGKYIERTFKLKFDDLTITQLKDFLERIETGSKVVIVKELHVKVNFRDKEKLDLDLTVATYFEPNSKKGDKSDKSDKNAEASGEDEG
jgi:cell division protein FtsB